MTDREQGRNTRHSTPQELRDCLADYHSDLLDTQDTYRNEYRRYFARWYGSPSTTDEMAQLGIVGIALVNNATWYKRLYDRSVTEMQECHKALGRFSTQMTEEPNPSNVSSMPQATRLTQPPTGQGIWPAGRAAAFQSPQFEQGLSALDIMIAEEILGKPLYDPTANQYNVSDGSTDAVSDGGIPRVG